MQKSKSLDEAEAGERQTHFEGYVSLSNKARLIRNKLEII